MIVNRFWCKFLNFSIRPLQEIVIWIQLLITLDRYFAIHYPNKLIFFNKPWYRLLTITVVIIFFLAANIPILIYFESCDDDD